MNAKPGAIAIGIILTLCLCLFVEAQARAPSRNTTKHTVWVGELKRTYYLHVPPNLPEDYSAPLVLMFHGGGGTPAIAERESRFSELADQAGFLVAYPEGFRKSWNDGRDVDAIPAQRNNVDDVAFVAALIDDMSKIHKLDPKRIYATGISNGAFFSNYLAVNLSPRIAAIAPVAGGLPERLEENFSPDEAVSVLMLNGTADPIVPYGGGDVTLLRTKRGRIMATEDAARKWALHNGCERGPVVEVLADKNPNDGCVLNKISYSNCSDDSEVTLYRMEGAGHTWPNGSQYLPQGLIGKVCREFNGAEVIWGFFSKHAKP